LNHTLGILGAGNMGQAIIRGAISANVLAADEMLVVEPDRAKRKAMSDLGCAVSEAPSDVLQAEQMMVAVKPQIFDKVAEQVGELPRSIVVISIMAGASSDRIRDQLGLDARVVRVMPNLPCQIGEGMAAIAPGAGAKQGDESLAKQIFESIGQAIVVEERLMHAVTAVSGSGPAYVFLLAEAMQQAAEQMGLPHGKARTLVKQTLLGAARVLSESDQTATHWRQSVTSPGGTTASALEVMFERELPEIVAEAILAARDRGVELDEGEGR